MRGCAAGVTFHDQPHVVHRDGATELWMTAFADPDDHHLILMQERAAPPSVPSGP